MNALRFHPQRLAARALIACMLMAAGVAHAAQPGAPGTNWTLDRLMSTLAQHQSGRVAFTETKYLSIATQPVELPNAGSVFRNPDSDHAAGLIEGCGLKGHAIGGARVSEKHANFIVNPGGRGSAADIASQIGMVGRERTKSITR